MVDLLRKSDRIPHRNLEFFLKVLMTDSISLGNFVLFRLFTDLDLNLVCVMFTFSTEVPSS